MMDDVRGRIFFYLQLVFSLYMENNSSQQGSSRDGFHLAHVGSAVGKAPAEVAGHARHIASIQNGQSRVV
jgi:hypothetical protein